MRFHDPSSIYRSPRSRFPNPAVDDEDYRMSANGSLRYTGRARGRTGSTRQPQSTEVGEGDDDENE